MTRDNIRRELRKFVISEYLLEKIIDWIIEHSEQIAEEPVKRSRVPNSETRREENEYK